MTVSWRYSEGFQTPGLKYFITNVFYLISFAGIYFYQDSERESFLLRNEKTIVKSPNWQPLLKWSLTFSPKFYSKIWRLLYNIVTFQKQDWTSLRYDPHDARTMWRKGQAGKIVVQYWCEGGREQIIVPPIIYSRITANCNCITIPEQGSHFSKDCRAVEHYCCAEKQIKYHTSPPPSSPPLSAHPTHK